MLAIFIKTLMHLYVELLETKGVDLAVFYAVDIALVIVGIIVIVVAIILASRGSKTKSDTAEGRVRGAGVIMIGPIPIIFGTDKKSVKAVLALTLSVMIVVLIIILINHWLSR